MPATAYQDHFALHNLPPPDLWPDMLFELAHLHYPDRLNASVHLLDHMVAQGHADSIAIHGSDQHWTYRQLQAKVNRIAQVLVASWQLPTGSRILLRGANHPMMAACVLAVWKAGYIAVPTMPLLRARELATIIDLAKVNAVLCAADLLTELESACNLVPLTPSVVEVAGSVAARIMLFNHTAPDALDTLMQASCDDFAAIDTAATDVCLLSFTSGTTGKPKGTMHFHRDILAICDCFPRSTLQIAASDVVIGTPPLAFTFGLGGLLLFPLRYGASAVLLGKLTPDSLLQAIDDYRATICFTAPTFYRQMTPLVARHSLASLQKTVSAGEALPLETRERWQQATGLKMIDGIGSTEMLHIFISASGDEIRPGATGKPIPGYQACILDQDGKVAPPGTPGRLAVKGPTGCRYLADERQKDYVRQGWNLTGDTYIMDADGYFWYQARTDDMIISAGYNIAGPEVEEALLHHPQVAECAVIGCPDAERGQIVLACVVPTADATPGPALEKALQDFVKSSIAPYKYPRRIEFRTSLPRTETGKLQRFKLRQEVAGELA